MTYNLANKTVLITGATDGLGHLLAIELAKQGCSVIVHGRNSEKLAQVQKELAQANPQGAHHAVQCDFNKPDTIQKAFAPITNLDILINNAGTWYEGDTVKMKPERVIELVNVNLLSYLLVSRLMLPILEHADFGQLLNVVSVAGYEVPGDYWHTVYSATKFGLQGFGEGLTKEYHDRNVRVMSYYPGGMETALFEKAGDEYDKHEPWMFDPQESVEAIVFMLTRNPKVEVKRMDLTNHLEK